MWLLPAARCARAPGAWDKSVSWRRLTVFFRQGEYVQAGQPVVALLPPANIKLRFFVPESELAALKLGQAIRVRCDGCGAPVVATLSHIASQAEYTPPVIYSNSQRARLVFMVEAKPEPADAARLHPGQPVDIERPAAGHQ
jgi:HlyD family secretion protein